MNYLSKCNAELVIACWLLKCCQQDKRSKVVSGWREGNPVAFHREHLMIKQLPHLILFWLTSSLYLSLLLILIIQSNSHICQPDTDLTLFEWLFFVLVIKTMHSFNGCSCVISNFDVHIILHSIWQLGNPVSLSIFDDFFFFLHKKYIHTVHISTVRSYAQWAILMIFMEIWFLLSPFFRMSSWCRSFPSTSNSALRGWRSLALRAWMKWSLLEKTPSSKMWTMCASQTTTGLERPHPASRTVSEGYATSSLRYSLNCGSACRITKATSAYWSVMFVSSVCQHWRTPAFCDIVLWWRAPHNNNGFLNPRWRAVERICTQECLVALFMKPWPTSLHWWVIEVAHCGRDKRITNIHWIVLQDRFRAVLISCFSLPKRFLGGQKREDPDSWDVSGCGPSYRGGEKAVWKNRFWPGWVLQRRWSWAAAARHKGRKLVSVF